MSREIKIWFSASEIEALGIASVARLPMSTRGSTQKAQREKWKSRKVPGKGGKGGLKTEYQPPQDILDIIHTFLNENPDFFSKGKQYKDEPATKLVSGGGSHKAHIANDHGDMNKNNYRRFDDYKPGSFNDFVLVPEYDVRASAGGGSVIHSEQIVGHLAFKKVWIRSELGCREKDLALITVKGDSMEPTLSTNDLILINLQQNKVTDNAVYVLQYNGSLLVKRIQRLLDGSLIIKSDNPAYNNEELSADQADSLNVLGVVVWYGRKM